MCEHCSAISNSNHMDVLEMDAASKTGIDDVRDLIEFSKYGPSVAKFKYSLSMKFICCQNKHLTVC